MLPAVCTLTKKMRRCKNCDDVYTYIWLWSIRFRHGRLFLFLMCDKTVQLERLGSRPGRIKMRPCTRCLRPPTEIAVKKIKKIKNNARCGARTHDPWIKSPMLYLSELTGLHMHNKFYNCSKQYRFIDGVCSFLRLYCSLLVIQATSILGSRQRGGCKREVLIEPFR